MYDTIANNIRTRGTAEFASRVAWGASAALGISEATSGLDIAKEIVKEVGAEKFIDWIYH